jgi:thiamine biosynthesis protein ThiI
MIPVRPFHILVHYGEIALKGGNRSYFEGKLARNIKQALGDFIGGPVDRQYGRFLVPLASPDAWEGAKVALARTFGIVSFSPVYRVAKDFEALKRAVAENIDGVAFRSFAVRARRADKTFPVNTPEIERELGGVVWEKTGADVDLESPERTIRVEVLWNEILFSLEKIAGPGGLPVGASGRVAVLLSGGIDSPVAAYLMMKRGCRPVYVHFHSAPYTTAASQEKVREIARLLSAYQHNARLYAVPFVDVQQVIVEKTPPPLRVILYRRFMMRIAERIAERERAGALVTGDNLGQVASQTLQNLAAIEAVARLPVLRPLVGYDKTEIIALARAVGTYDISIEPHQDCCSYLMPRNPATKSRPEELADVEKSLEVEGLVAGALEKVKLEVIEEL